MSSQFVSFIHSHAGRFFPPSSVNVANVCVLLINAGSCLTELMVFAYAAIIIIIKSWTHLTNRCFMSKTLGLFVYEVPFKNAMTIIAHTVHAHIAHRTYYTYKHTKFNEVADWKRWKFMILTTGIRIKWLYIEQWLVMKGHCNSVVQKGHKPLDRLRLLNSARNIPWGEAKASERKIKCLIDTGYA